MLRRAFVFASVICLLFTLLSPTLAQARDGLTVLNSSAEVEFPLKLTFSLSAESGVDIDDIRLSYTVDRESFARVVSEAYLEFVPDTTVDVEWTLDMRKIGGMPPGTVVEYWWTVEDVGNERVTTAPLEVEFSDGRYSWQSLSAGQATIYWYEGKQSFAEEIMLTIEQVLARLAETTGAYPKQPFRLYIYASSRDLQGAMIFPQEWTGGATFTRYGTIAIGIAPYNLAWGRRAVAHELAHLVIHQMTINPYTDLPRWLDEGLAMYAEGELEPESEDRLKRVVASNSLISVRSLASPFSTDAEKAKLAYAQSYSLVEFLISGYGQVKMLELLDTFSRGSGYDQALLAVYGFDMDGLNTLWQEYVRAEYQEVGQ